MACACQKKNSSAKQTYTVVSSSGATRTFSSKADAELYASRSGGTIK